MYSKLWARRRHSGPEVLVVTACRKAGQGGCVPGGPVQPEGQCGQLPPAGRLPRRLTVFRGAGQPGVRSRLWTPGTDSWGTLGSGTWRFLWRRCGLCLLPPSLWSCFLPKAANLTALVDEKELSVREKAEALLQKEQEILQLKKGEEPAPGRALSPVPAQHPRPAAARLGAELAGLTVPTRLPSARPRSRRGPAAHAPAADRAGGPAQPEGSGARGSCRAGGPAEAAGPGAGAGALRRRASRECHRTGPLGQPCAAGRRVRGWLPHFARRGRQWEDTGALGLPAGVCTSLPCASASFL